MKKGTDTAMQDELNYIKPGRYKKPVDADSRRDEFDLKNGEVLYSGRPVDIIFTGDSITHFMEANLYYGKFGLVLNRGIGGEVADILAWRFHADVTQLHPRLCILMVGINNTWELDSKISKKGLYDRRAANKVLALLEKSYRSMLEEAKENSFPLWMCSCLPTGENLLNLDLRNRFIVEINQMIQRLVAEYGTKYVDYHSHLVKEDGITLQDGISREGCHPNYKGYTMMSEVLTPMLEEFFQKK